MSSSSGSFLQARDFLLAHRTDYATAYRDFRWPRLSRFNWALDYFDEMAKDNDRIALWVVDEAGGEVKLSFAELSRRSNQVANFLRGQRVRRGDAVLVMLGNVVPLWEVMLACMKLGAVIIPAPTLLSGADLRDPFERAGVRHVIVGLANADKFDAIPGYYGRIVVGGARAGWTSYPSADAASPEFTPEGPTDASDPLLLYFTSGTTAEPKLVSHSHQSYPVGHLSTMYWIGLMPGDVHLNFSSPGWAKHAWSNVFAPWNAGATVLVYGSERFDAKTLDVIARCGVTSLCAPPRVWRMLIREDLTAYPVKLRELVAAGETLDPEVIEQVRKAWNLVIREGYGQTETTCQIANPPGQKFKPGSMGRPMPGCRVALLGEDDKPAREGEICLALDERPLGLMAGYADDPTKTAHLMRDGYYHSGDLATVDDEGYFTYVGRMDDVFKSSDYRISPVELESVLIEHEAVAEAAVVPSPDPLRLAVPKAFVALRDGYEASPELALSIFDHIRTSLAPYKRIRRIEVLELPKTSSGKIRKAELARLEKERRLSSSRGAREFFEEDFPELES